MRRIAALLALMVAGPALAATDAPPVPELLENGYLKIGFDHLASYPFTPPQYDPSIPKPATGEEQIPAAIKALSGRRAVITGYMVPVKMDKGLTTELLLMRNTMACCFGAVPAMNEWVVVRIPKGVSPLMDTPVAFYGELKVGALFDNGYVTGVYELDAEKMLPVR